MQIAHTTVGSGRPLRAAVVGARLLPALALGLLLLLL